jgi:hypothetical protein
LLIRSELVASWPGLAITATSDSQPVALLRLDILAPNVMLCLFNGVPDQVTLAQPHEALTLGVDDEGKSQVRTLNGPDITTQPGPVIYDCENPTQTLVTIRSGAMRVLNINSDPNFPSATAPETPVDVLGTLAQALDTGTDALGAALFALQIMAGPEQVTFGINAGNGLASGELPR